MAYSAKDKFTQPAEGIVVVAYGPTDEEIVEAQARIAQGEDAAKVWDDIDARAARRERRRLGME